MVRKHGAATTSCTSASSPFSQCGFMPRSRASKWWHLPSTSFNASAPQALVYRVDGGKLLGRSLQRSDGFKCAIPASQMGLALGAITIFDVMSTSVPLQP
eukprot:315353-Amphidinium_carterae.1